MATRIVDISIHAPRGGSDVLPRIMAEVFISFQSTLPAGGATLVLCRMADIDTISIHAPRGGSDCSGRHSKLSSKDFNPRSPRGERQRAKVLQPAESADFNPRSPRGERLVKVFQQFAKCCISIHAPRGGSDYSFALTFASSRKISIHAPRGGSDFLQGPGVYHWFVFQSTLPAGGATSSYVRVSQ